MNNVTFPTGELNGGRQAGRWSGLARLVRSRVAGFVEHGIAGMAATISSHALLSLAPLLVIAIAGAVWGRNGSPGVVGRFGPMVDEQGGGTGWDADRQRRSAACEHAGNGWGW